VQHRGPRRPIYEALTHNISVHTPHHIDTLIPFCRLKEAYADLEAAGFGADIVEYRLSWSTVHEVFKTCKLLDFDTQTWYRFSDLDRIPAASKSAAG
jgi:omega-6 fatty acid desaturase (delta-12 desaturase)